MNLERTRIEGVYTDVNKEIYWDKEIGNHTTINDKSDTLNMNKAVNTSS